MNKYACEKQEIDGTSRESYLVVSSRNSENVASDGPRNVPNDIFEGMEHTLRPAAGYTVVGPQNHTTILRAASNNSSRESNGWCPRYIANPIRVPLKFGLFNPFFVFPVSNNILVT